MREKGRFSNTAVRSALLALSALTLAVAPTGAAPEARDPAGAEDVLSKLPPGAVVPPLAVSPRREWVQISFPGTASGVGWVYASFVTVSGGELPVVEAPPTPTPLVTSTIDPTLAAAFNIQPTQTRMPTFTPPPPLDIPKFEDRRSPTSVLGIFIIVLGIVGSIGLVVSFVLRK